MQRLKACIVVNAEILRGCIHDFQKNTNAPVKGDLRSLFFKNNPVGPTTKTKANKIEIFFGDL